MNFDAPVGGAPVAPGPARSSRLESTAFYILLVTIILAPLAFLSTPYISLDAVKTVLIAAGTLISAILYGVVMYKERSLTLPPRSITWTSILLVISVVISSLMSVHMSKSFFGQGFELTAGSFLLVLMVAALGAFVAAYRKSERIPLIYLSMAVPFIILAILHAARLLIGPSFISLGILPTVTATLVGTWYDLASYALVIVFMAVPALMFLRIGARVRVIYWILLIVALVGAFLINSVTVWTVAALVMLALTIYASAIRPRSTVGGIARIWKRLAWLPLVLFIISGVLALWGGSIAGPVITSLDAQYTTLSLPWQLTLDVDAGVLKDSPLFGAGPNQFGQAYVTHKPPVINTTYVWSAEFNYAFSLLATFVATQGIVGTVLWLLFLIFLGILLVRGLRHTSDDPQMAFAVTASTFVAIFLWVMQLFSVPSHTMLFYTYIATGLAIASIVKVGVATACTIAPRTSGRSKALSIVLVVLVAVGVVWTVVYIKNAVALAHFGSGIKSLTAKNDAAAADKSFARAYALDRSDVYLRARAEAGISEANRLIGTVRADAPASTSQAILTQVFDTINTSIAYAQSAVAYDPTNYYNHVSEARVSEAAASVRMDKAYDNAVSAYTRAIQRNPLNPALYLSLARLHASQNKLDEATRTLGAALQVKNNYLEAIFLLSQVTAAQGNLRDAIIAAQVATQLNPRNPVLFFQLGILQYNNKDYAAAAKALETAIGLQSDYANAQYFLGLSYARLNDLAKATEQFSNLAVTNPENQEVAFILANLQSGKSPFADAKPPVTPAPEKRTSLPIKEKKK